MVEKHLNRLWGLAMPRGVDVYKNDQTGIIIRVSWPARELIGSPNLPSFTLLLHRLMWALEVEQAYVSKRGAAIDVHLIRSDGWNARMKFDRRRRAWEKRAKA